MTERYNEEEELLNLLIKAADGITDYIQELVENDIDCSTLEKVEVQKVFTPYFVLFNLCIKKIGEANTVNIMAKRIKDVPGEQSDIFWAKYYQIKQIINVEEIRGTTNPNMLN